MPGNDTVKSSFKNMALITAFLFMGLFCSQDSLQAQEKEAGKTKESSGTNISAEKKNAEDSSPANAGAKRRQRGRTDNINQSKVLGFIDKDRDGRNDIFRDANGDGINDVDGKPYPHRFSFADNNKDGINDRFVDEDGDGVNDLNPEFVDEDGDGVCDNVIDFSGKLINGITGMRYNTKSLRGYKFGFINEERREMMRNFIDENADGIPDMPGRGGIMMGQQGEMQPPGRDRFIDRDGDGIDDRRQRMEQMRKGRNQ